MNIEKNPPRLAGEAALWPSLMGFLGIVVIVMMAMRHIAVPAPRGADAPDTAFSATRAMRHVASIASTAHPIGTADHARVRQYLVRQIQALGYTPEIQSGTVVSPRANNIAAVENIMVRIPGQRPGKALMLSAHYDTAPFSPGAADDGASVAAILETLRALKAGAPLQNDLICLFTDGEEAGMLGAQLFVAKHPWAGQVGLALNFEYRGNSGPVWMFETSELNGRLIDGWRSAAPGALGNSMLYEVYQRMPNGTDMTPFKMAGMAGMNFAAGERHTSYHTQLDRADLLNQGTLQQQGDLMLSLARHFGALPLSTIAAENRIYFDFPWIGTVVYSPTLAIILGVTLLAGYAMVLRRALRDGQARIGRAIAAAPLLPLAAILLAVVCQCLWRLVCMVHPGYQLLLHGNTYNGNWYLAAFSALALGLFAVLLRLLERWFRPFELALGMIMFVLVLLGLTTALLPGASFLFAWPVLPVLVAMYWRLEKDAPVGWTLAVLVVAAAPALLIGAPVIHLMFFALTPMLLAGTIFLLTVFLGALTPVWQQLRHRYVMPLLPLALSAAFFAVGGATSGFGQQQPRPVHLSFVQQGEGGKAFWISADEQLAPWAAGYLSGTARRGSLPTRYWPDAPQLWLQPAAQLDLPPPDIQLLGDHQSNGSRLLTLAVSSRRQAPWLELHVDGAEVRQAELQGQRLQPSTNGKWAMYAHAMKDRPVQIQLTLPAGKPFTVRALDFSYELPQDALARRPDDNIIQPFRDSGMTQLVSVMPFK